MTSTRDEGSQALDEPPAQRHWAVIVLAALGIAILACNVAVLNASGVSPAGLTGLALAVLPNVLSAVIIAIVLYLFLGRPRDSHGSEDAGRTLHLSDDALDALARQIRPSASAGNVLRARDELPPLRDLAAGARTISICAVSGLGLSNRRGVWEACLGDGAHLRVLLLNPKASAAITTWDELSNPPMLHPARDIESGIQQFHTLTNVKGKGRCELRITDVLLPFSMIVFDYGSSVTVQVELHALNRAPDDRPNVLIHAPEAPSWAEFFADQFARAWDRAEPPRDELTIVQSAPKNAG